MRRTYRCILLTGLNVTLALSLMTLTACAGGGASSGGQGGSASDGVTCSNGQITVWGEAPIFTSIASARDKAKEDACRKAVEKCLGEEVASVTGVSDGQSIANELFTQARGICKNDQIVDEQQYNLDTVKMLKIFVRFQVSPSDIRNSINTMRELVGNPKVMVLIREEYDLPPKRVEGFASRNSVSASLLRESLVSKGYTVLDASSVARAISNEEYFAENPAALTDEIKDAAARAGADVLIIGRIQVSPQNISALRGSDFKSYRAQGNVQIQTLWGYGKLLGEFTGTEPGAQVEALAAARAAVQKLVAGRDSGRAGGLADFIHKRLSDEWAMITRNNQIKMTIVGLDQAEAGVFKDNLIEAASVKKVDEISFSPQQAVWDVYYPGRSFALSDTLGFYGENPAMFSVLKMNCKRLEVLGVDRGEIRLRFTSGRACN